MSTLERNFAHTPGRAAADSTFRARAPTRVLLALLRRLEHGELHVRLPDGTLHRFGEVSGAPAVLAIANWRVAADTLMGGDVAFAEGYMRGDWDTPDLERLLGVIARNQAALERAVFGRGLTTWLARLKHLLRANTRRQARRNIVAHYDLGNDFYRLWLDPTMTYSSGCYEGDPARTLEQSQQAKYRRMLDTLRLPAGAQLRRLIARFMHEYEHSATRHRVLVQDVKYLSKAHRARVMARQRAVVDGFAQVVEELSPAASAAALRKPLTMMLFGMMNWTFTWFSARGPLRYDDLAPIVADLFIGGLGRLRGLPSGGASPSARRPRARAPVMKAMA